MFSACVCGRGGVKVLEETVEPNRTGVLVYNKRMQ